MNEDATSVHGKTSSSTRTSVATMIFDTVHLHLEGPDAETTFGMISHLRQESFARSSLRLRRVTDLILQKRRRCVAVVIIKQRFIRIHM
jgi:hypothetical protein